MSYTNPQQVVDTQTGQHYRNLQQSLSSTFAGVAKSYKAEQDKLEEEQKQKEAKNKAIVDFNQKQEDTVMDSVAKLKAKNPALDTSAIYDMVDRYSDIKNTIDLGTITDKVELRKMREQLAQIRSIPDGLGTSLTGLSALSEDFTEYIAKAGKKGGLDLKSADPNVLNQLNVFLNKTKGERRFQTQFDENGSMRTGIFLKSNEEGDEGKFYTEEELTSYMDGDIEGIPKIYDDTKDLDTMESMIVGKETGTDRPIIKEAYLKEDKEVLKDGSIRINKVIDTDKVRSALKPQAVATINSLKPNEIVSFYNNILSDGNTKKYISTEELKDDGIKERVYGDYLEYVMQQRNLVDYKKKDYTYSLDKKDEPLKPDYNDVTSVVESLKSGDYQDVAFPGTVDNIKKSESVAKKGQNIVSVEIEVGTKLFSKEFDLNSKTSLISLAEEIFKGDSKEIRSKRSEFVKQMLSKNNASASDNKEPTGSENDPLIYKP